MDTSDRRESTGNRHEYRKGAGEVETVRTTVTVVRISEGSPAAEHEPAPAPSIASDEAGEDFHTGRKLAFDPNDPASGMRQA